MSDFSTVQFRDAMSVVRAYENRGVPAFCIRNKNQFLFSYKGDDLDSGKDMLVGYLDLLEKSQSAGIYTLCVYEDLPKGGRITNKTEYDGSFNFRFTDVVAVNSTTHPFMEEIRSMREEIKILHERLEEKNEVEESSGEDTMGAISRIIENPMIAPLVGVVMEKIMGLLDNKPQQNLQGEAETKGLKAVSGVEVDNEIFYSYEILCGARKDFPELFKKLALLAKNKPTQFGIYCNMLKGMKI